MLRVYLGAGLAMAAVGAFFWIRADAANDREKQIRAEITEQAVIEIREDMASDENIDKKSDDDLRNLALEWVLEAGPN